MKWLLIIWALSYEPTNVMPQATMVRGLDLTVCKDVAEQIRRAPNTFNAACVSYREDP